MEARNGEMIIESDNDSQVAEEQAKLMDVNDPEWTWPTHEKWFSRLEGNWKTKETTNLANNKRLRDGLRCPFEVTTQISDVDHEDIPEVLVTLCSHHLISVVRTHLPHMVETMCCEEPAIDAKDLFNILPTLQNELKAAQDGGNSTDEACQVLQDGDDEPENLHNVSNATDPGDKAVAQLHLKHLMRFLDEHFKDTSAKFAWMKQEGLVSYNMLWAFLTPGLEVCRICNLSGQECSAIIQEGKYQKLNWDPSQNCFKIKLRVLDYNGESYRKCALEYEIKEFDGEVPFTSLKVCPWSFFSSQERCNMTDHLQRRGQLFYNYVVKEPFRFMHYRGALGFFETDGGGCFQLRRINADGRVMVDLVSLARANPEWPLGNAQPPSELMRGVEKQGLDVTTKHQKMPTDKELEYAPAIVYGFSFSLKKWGCFDVGGLTEITFEDEAYEQLVMRSAQQKEMLKAIVTTHLSVKGEGRGLDVVAQKGAGCVVLCFGPPGTGKTLTAETLAETLHRPLWAISACELGEYAGELERCLSNVLSTALRWRAVVLLDEADGYLERREFNVDITRNLMTGVFLRLLEYYSGVLFLTTNRVCAFDEAFLSRISLCISYPALDNQRRMLIWQNLLAQASLAATEANLNSLLQCGQSLNGREIRNIIGLAHTWARSRAQPLRFEDVHDVLQLVVAGSKELRENLESGVP